MTNHRLRWALLCVAATYGALQASNAYAAHTVTIGPGTSLDSLARKYRVSKKDIARANGIGVDSLLIDGKKITIPDPQKAVLRPVTMKRIAHVCADRVTVRSGPFEGYRRVALLDSGVSLVATHQAGNWFQVDLPGGKKGWIREDFVRFGNARNSAPVTPQRVARKDNGDRKSAHSNRTRVAKVERHQTHIAKAERHRTRIAKVERLHRRIAKAEKAQRHSRREVAWSRRSSRPEAGAPEATADVVRTAYLYRGIRYRYTGSTPRGFDCSGFTSYVYRKKGVSLPHSAAEQYGHGQKVSGSSMKPGDLVFFSTTRRGISHVGIYAGDGKFVHASSGGGRVRVDTLRSGYYSQRFRGARRVSKD